MSLPNQYMRGWIALVCYHYYKRTKDAATLTEIFGHASPRITKRYIGINDDEIADSLKDFRL